jgi:hypothetical protein
VFPASTTSLPEAADFRLPKNRRCRLKFPFANPETCAILSTEPDSFRLIFDSVLDEQGVFLRRSFVSGKRKH